MPAVAAGVRVAAQGQPLLLKCKPVSSATSRVSVHKIRILSGMWNRPRSIRTRVSSTKNGILRSPERRQRAELTQSAAPTEAYRRPRPCRGPAKLRKSLALSDGSDKCATETELVGWACRIRTGKCDFEGRLLQSCCAQGLRALRSWTSATKSFGSVMIIVQDLASRLVFPLIT